MSDDPDSSAIQPDRDDVNVEPLPRMEFTEEPAPGEPDTDRYLALEDGTRTRERMTVTGARADDTRTDAPVLATAFTIVISHALVDEKDAVQQRDGAIFVAPFHEITLTNEALGRLGSDQAAQDAIADIRRIAAAQASQAFVGSRIAANLLRGRGQDVPTIPARED